MKSKTSVLQFLGTVLISASLSTSNAQESSSSAESRNSDSEKARLQEIELDLNESLMDPDKTRNPHRIRLQAQAMFNVRLDVSNGQSNVGADTTTVMDRTYDNGFVNDNGTGGALTADWGVLSPTQFDSANGTVLFDAASPTGSGTIKNETEDPQLGFELSYGFEMAKVWGGYAGLEFGFGYTDISVDGIRSRRITDAYTFVPAAPPSLPELSKTFTRGFTDTVLDWDSSLYSFRLGPFIEWELSDRFSAGLGGGPWLAVLDNRISINEITSYGTRPMSSTASSSEFGVGLYTDARVAFAITENWQVYGGARYQFLDSVGVETGSVSAEMKMNASVTTFTGIGFSF